MATDGLSLIVAPTRSEGQSPLVASRGPLADPLSANDAAATKPTEER